MQGLLRTTRIVPRPIPSFLRLYPSCLFDTIRSNKNNIFENNVFLALSRMRIKRLVSLGTAKDRLDEVSDDNGEVSEDDDVDDSQEYDLEESEKELLGSIEDEASQDGLDGLDTDEDDQVFSTIATFSESSYVENDAACGETAGGN